MGDKDAADALFRFYRLLVRLTLLGGLHNALYDASLRVCVCAGCDDGAGSLAPRPVLGGGRWR
jgi:hypothetical protein